ncbi:hypothetical protein U9M48_002348 [Paspalum notatum var. saurae]|uniref:Disease resistance R13L4/SHOC-2-like LRR domain-containing protein n=1 Tax=Paspalum notatum var. saurae TaxID=547442 RepID=A0AAQ3SJQ7_PASNO
MKRNRTDGDSSFSNPPFRIIFYLPSLDHELLEFPQHRAGYQLVNDISECKRLKRSSSKLLLMQCYNELPSKYRTCLLYLTIFPQGHVIRTTSLARSATADATSSDDRIIQSATDEPSTTWRRFSSQGLFLLWKSVLPATSTASQYIVKCENSSPGSQERNPIQTVTAKVLRKKHLQDSYLSLRNTDVVQLPKQIKDLHCLETLDIRQTKVRMLAKKAIVLPQLKHFLAGHNIFASIPRTRIPEKLCSAVEIPLGIQKMENMEILSHVHVSNSDVQLSAIARLLKLRKLGVSLRSEKTTCLRSLSIRIDQPAGPENQDARITTKALHLLPNFIERLSICGIKSGLVYSIKDHHQLTKITLSETFLGEDDICILGKISKLCGLRLLHNSYTAASKLSFMAEEFQRLRSLVVDSSNITNNSFDNGAAPDLEVIVWSFNTLEDLSGLRNLCRLLKLELNGDCADHQLALVKEQIIWDYPNYLNHFKIEHNPQNHCQ